LKSRANGISRNWDIAQLKCRAIEMSRRWDVALEKSRANGIFPIKCRSLMYVPNFYEILEFILYGVIHLICEGATLWCSGPGVVNHPQRREPAAF